LRPQFGCEGLLLPFDMHNENLHHPRSQSLPDESSLRNEISFRDLLLHVINWFNYVVLKWKIIVIVVLLGAAVGFIHANRQKLKYIATSTFVLQEPGTSSGSSDTFASILGINSPEGSGMFQGDNLLELYRSRFMIKKTLLSKIPEEDIYLIDRYIQINHLQQGWKNNPYLRHINWFLKPDKSNKKIIRAQDSLITLFVNDIRYNYLNIGRDRQLNIFRVEVRSKNEDFSKLLNDQIVHTVNDFYVDTKTRRSLENLSLMQHQADSIKAALTNAMYRTASSADYVYNANPAMQVTHVPSQRNQVEAENNRAMLNELVRNLEVSKVALRKETPLIQIIDEPVFPLEKRRASRAKGLIIGGLIAGVVAVFYYSLVLLISRILYHQNEPV
jgi:tetrahydromethanopterin S-methyltransferase subunit F